MCVDLVTGLVLELPLIGLIELSLNIFRDYFDVDLFHFMIWGIPYCVLHPPQGNKSTSIEC